MTGAELLETYPKAAKVIGEFYNNKLIDSMNDSAEGVSEEFKEMLKQQSFDNEYVAAFIDSNPRFLFDVFDSNAVYIEILVDLTKDNALFNYIIDGDVMGNVEATLYNSRIEAEAAAIEQAFEILNNKLCQIK
jgi:hypothetical protein